MLRLTQLLAALAVAGATIEVPIYCRLLQVGLESAQLQPALEDLNLSTAVHAPVVGRIDVWATRLEIASAKVLKCDASVDQDGRFNVAVSHLDLDLRQLQWQYAQARWPHVADHGLAAANTTVSLNVSIDMVNDRHRVFALELSRIDFDLHPVHHTWATGTVERLTRFTRPLVSMVVQLAAEMALDGSLAIIHKQGGCAFLQDVLKEVDLVRLQFTSYEPITTHVPILGAVNISVNSTFVEQPESMRCEQAAFNGSRLSFRVEDVPFRAGFRWGYQKLGSTFWHNQGTGLADVVAGTRLHIDLLRPTETEIHMDLPVLKLELRAEADAWMYKALTTVMVPLVREALQHFGGELLAHYVAKCLEDPSCPRVRPAPRSSAALPLASTVVVV